jgi:hypothetical protein
VECREFVGIKELGGAWVVFIIFTGVTPAFLYLGAGLPKHTLVGGVLPFDQLFYKPKEALPLLLLGLLGREKVGCAEGSSTICAKMTARAAASGRLAHHRCRVLGWPWRMDFSLAEAALMASSGGRLR